MSSPAATPKAAYHRWNDVPHEQVTELLGRRLVTGERIMVAQVELTRGCIVPKHAHVHEQMTVILEGCLRLKVGDDGAESYDLRAGELISLPCNVPHAAEALEDTRVLDVFSPPREDWINRTDEYLRR
ncbi:MAG TPA: cupin domain-containing protein [Gemmatimonadaceae bacterium]|nr:cupin domain-containing protein [Gemmatimonadaceae bacterium]